MLGLHLIFDLLKNCFGILMTRAFVDELLYNEKGNEALLIKYLIPDKTPDSV